MSKLQCSPVTMIIVMEVLILEMIDIWFSQSLKFQLLILLPNPVVVCVTCCIHLILIFSLSALHELPNSLLRWSVVCYEDLNLATSPDTCQTHLPRCGKLKLSQAWTMRHKEAGGLVNLLCCLLYEENVNNRRERALGKYVFIAIDLLYPPNTHQLHSDSVATH